MTPRLLTLPYEVLSYIVEYISFEDVISLSHTSKQLQFLGREDSICKKVLEEKLAFCDETIAAQNARSGYASALRRVAKRHEAIATARPFSIAIVGFGDDFLYCHGALCYILDDSLRVLDLFRSRHDEVVISISGLLCKFLLESEQGNAGRFRVLYCNEGIVSCLYVSKTADPVAYLIAFDLRSAKLLLTHDLPCTDKIFVRHTSSYLYYGTFSEEDHLGHKKWLLRGYCFGTESWLEQRIFLGELNGSEIGSTICFEIYDGFFYALSNQTNHDVEEVDWTSFYHSVRFPVASPSKKSLEKTAMDENMWRRQHREGPLDDRWGNLALEMDEVTGDLKIVETRKEFLFGASRSQRTYYTTKLVFPRSHWIKSGDLQNLAENSRHSNAAISSLTTTALNIDSSSDGGNFERHTLAALTNDRLALTLKPSDNPHWLPPQTRFPRNFHHGDDGYVILSQSYLRTYNCAARSFLDFVDDPLPGQPSRQRLRLRTGSRKLKPPATDSQGLLIQVPRDPITGEILYALSENYSTPKVALWPADHHSWGAEDKRLDDLDKLMNPPSHLGNIEAMADERSFIYSTGDKNQPRALILVCFDPAIRLENLRKWNNYEGSALERRIPNADESSAEYKREIGGSTGKGKEKEIQIAPGQMSFPKTEPKEPQDYYFNNGAEDEMWIRKEPAMYIAIDRGFDFGL